MGVDVPGKSWRCWRFLWTSDAQFSYHINSMFSWMTIWVWWFSYMASYALCYLHRATSTACYTQVRQNLASPHGLAGRLCLNQLLRSNLSWLIDFLLQFCVDLNVSVVSNIGKSSWYVNVVLWISDASRLRHKSSKRVYKELVWVDWIAYLEIPKARSGNSDSKKETLSKSQKPKRVRGNSCE